MDKLIFFHMNQLGDLLFSLPVLKSARLELKSEMYSIVKSDLSPLLTVSGLVDVVIPKETFSIGDIKNQKINKAILFSQSPSSLISAYFSRIKDRIGFSTSSLSFLLTKKVQSMGVPSLLNNRNLGFAFGLKTIQKDYCNIVNIPKNCLDNVWQWFINNRLNASKTIVISVGASKKRQSKCLNKDIWIDVIDKLSEKGFYCVLSGAKWETEVLSEIALKCKVKPKLFAAQGGILENAALFKTACLFVGIDSGAMHLAAAVGAKCIAVFGLTDPIQVGPMPLEKHVIIKKDKISLITSQDIVSKVIAAVNSSVL